MRGAAHLRHQLIETTVIASEHHDHAVPWKSHDTIQRETARIQQDLLRTNVIISSRSSTPTRLRAKSSTPTRLRARPSSPTRPVIREKTSVSGEPASSNRYTSRASTPTSLFSIPNQSTRDKPPAVVSDDEDFDDVWSKLRPVQARQKKVDREVVHLSPRSDLVGSLCGEKDLNCLSFASRGDASKWADFGLLENPPPIQKRPQDAGNAKATEANPKSTTAHVHKRLESSDFKILQAIPVPNEQSPKKSLQAPLASQNDVVETRVSVLCLDLKSKRKEHGNNVVQTDFQDPPLISFIESDNDDDDNAVDVTVSVYKAENTPKPAVTRMGSFMGKYSERLSCIIPKFSSATPATSTSTTPSREQRQGPPSFEEYKPQFSGDDEIEIAPLTRSEKSNVLRDYSLLIEDPAYLHAQQAGFLWQSLVGQHVRFPRHWWNGQRGPPMNDKDETLSPWYHLGSSPVRNHKLLKNIVRNRASSGRLLLHILVRDALSGETVCDLAIGCYHPNARGIRKKQEADRSQEGERNVWMAFRKRTQWSVTVLDQWLKADKDFRSPIGKGSITNHNVRVVYGEKSPLETLFLSESDLLEIISKAPESPALALCESFVFS